MLLPVLTAFALHPGDVVCFYGDSITQQQLYTVYAEALVRERYPNLKLRFYNRGWSGDATWGGGGGGPDQRIDRDVMPLKPTVVTVMLGMNDGGYVPYDPKIFNTFNDWYGKLLGFIHKDCPSARLTLIQTSPWDDFAHKHEPFSAGSWHPWQGYNETLLQYGEVVRTLADRDRDSFVDFNRPVAAMLQKAATDDPDEAKNIIADSIHPGPAGHLIMAEALLKSWNVDPVVSAVVLDAGMKEVEETKNCKVSHFDGLSWSEMDNSLPFAIERDKTIQLALRNSDFEESLNQETLKVKGLGQGDYDLSIDGTVIGKFSADHLAGGLNLAELQTPMTKQALEVLKEADRRSHLDFMNWREIGIDEATLHSTASAVKAIDRMEEEITSLEIAAAQPKPHQYVLKKI